MPGPEVLSDIERFLNPAATADRLDGEFLHGGQHAAESGALDPADHLGRGMQQQLARPAAHTSVGHDQAARS